MRLYALITVSMFGLLSAACASSTPDATTPDPNNPCPPGQYCAPPPSTAPTTVTTAPPANTTPAAGSPATPISAAMATPVLTALAGDKVKGMKPQGDAFAGQFTTGQTLEQTVTLEPGKCYAVIGASLPGGVTELDIKLVSQPLPPLPPVVLAQDQTTGPNAVVGGSDSCFRNALPAPIPGKVIVTATGGQGISGAQIYVK